MAANSPQYKLRCKLRAHREDVRSVCVCGESGVATASRDKSVCFWGLGKEGYELKKTLFGHTSFVGAVAWVPPCDELPSGGLVSGGMDTRVLVWDLGTASLWQELSGHDQQITSVAVDAQGDVLSGSVDSNVRRWRKGKVVEVLKGHTGPVQALLVLPTGEIVTGSSDTTIKIWRGSTCFLTLSGHSDTVRGLAFLPSIGILSASHDGSVRLWALNGEVLQEMAGHSAMVYSVAAHSSGDVASASEDRTARIWRDGVCCQSIEHPGCVWDVKYLSNGDLVTACSDGVARVWTLDHDSCVTAVEIETTELPPITRKTEMKTSGGVKLGDFSSVEALQQDRETAHCDMKAKSFLSSPHPSWSTNRHLGLDDLEGEDEVRSDFSCPHCYEDFDIMSLCAHLEDEHFLENKPAICPVCVAKIGKDMVAHITLQHSHLFKMQRRRRFRRAGAPTNSTLSLLGKELREAHLHALLGGSSSRAGSINSAATDHLLNLVYSLPIPGTEDGSKPGPENDDMTGKGSVSMQQQTSSFEASLTTEERQHRFQQAHLRAKFVQQLMLSTLLKDS